MRYRYAVDTRRPLNNNSGWMRQECSNNPFKIIEQYNRIVRKCNSLDSVRIMRWDNRDSPDPLSDETLIKIHNPKDDDLKVGESIDKSRAAALGL